MLTLQPACFGAADCSVKLRDSLIPCQRGRIQVEPVLRETRGDQALDNTAGYQAYPEQQILTV